jgi:hypothetical protein
MRAVDNDRGSSKPYSGDPEVDAVTTRVRMAINESNSRNSKPRTKASDTSKMNKVYKPKSSPGPASLNLYGAPKNPPASARTLNLYGAPKPKAVNANTRENRTSGPKSNSANVRENRVGATKPKSKRTPIGDIKKVARAIGAAYGNK